MIYHKIIVENVKLLATTKSVRRYMKEFDISYLESVAYLYFWNYTHIRLDDFKKDCGRQMFVKHAKVLPKILKEIKNEDTSNRTN